MNGEQNLPASRVDIEALAYSLWYLVTITITVVPQTLTNLYSQGIESQRLFMFKIQRDFYTNICKRSQQNEEIVGFNTRLSKVYSSPISLYYGKLCLLPLITACV